MPEVDEEALECDGEVEEYCTKDANSLKFPRG
jgi:hypothetical protein